MRQTYRPYLDVEELTERRLWVDAIRANLRSWTTVEHTDLGSGMLAMFVRKSCTGKAAFIVVDPADALTNINRDVMRSLVRRCLDVCKQKEGTRGVSLHVVVIHRGEVRADSIEGSTPFYRGLGFPFASRQRCVSMTLVDTVTSRIDQYRGYGLWGLVPNAAQLDVLLRLRYLQQPNLGVVGIHRVEKPAVGFGLVVCWILQTIILIVSLLILVVGGFLALLFLAAAVAMCNS